MLILTRKPGETVLVDNEIEVIVLDIKDGRARLGFKAPENIRIIRKELKPKPQKDNF